MPTAAAASDGAAAGRLAEGQAEVNGHYSDDELARIRDFLAESHALMVRETERLEDR